MDPVPATIAASVTSALVGALLTLWRKQEKGEAAASAREADCNERGVRLEAEVVATKALVIDIYRERAKDADARAEISARRELQMADTARVCARVLKRYENTPVPNPTGETSALVPIVRG